MTDSELTQQLATRHRVNHTVRVNRLLANSAVDRALLQCALSIFHRHDMLKYVTFFYLLHFSVLLAMHCTKFDADHLQ